MSLELMIFCSVIAILGLALFGFVMLLRLMFVQPPKPAGSKTGDEQDLQATLVRVATTCELVDQLFRRKLLSEEAYQEVRQSLESHYGRFLELPPRVSSPEFARKPSEQKQTLAASEVATDEEVIVASLASETQTTPQEILPVPRKEEEAKVDVGQAGDVVPDQVVARQLAAATTTGEVQESAPKSTSRSSPFDIPDEPAAVHQRTFKEMLAGFMEKKNIRWGELASGILIVGSAVGLVFSLRDVLQDRIPYFTAILFMLITAAIHAAGIYTLKKWKLRNTSRGVLVIGLLLIPINFFAACLLTGNGIEKRELTDPLYWIAIAVGLGAFGVMAWVSGQNLFRKYGLPVFVAVLGISVWSLVVNRAEDFSGSIVSILVLIAPATVFFLIATWRIVPRQWTRERIGSRLENRMLLVLGIAVFALASVVMLMLARSEHRLITLAGLIPAFTAVALMVCAMGGVIRDARSSNSKSVLVGLSLSILGATIVAMGAVFAFSNSLLLLTNSVVIAVGLAAIAWNRGWPQAVVGVWISLWTLAVSLLTYSQAGEIAVWHSVRQVAERLIDGWTAVLLMVIGLIALSIGQVFRSPSQIRFSKANQVSGGCLAVAGCAFALLASFLNPENVTDSIIATTLLGLLTVGSLFAACRSQLEWFSVGASVVLIAFLGHMLFWNPASNYWMSDVQLPIDGRWLSLFTTAGLVTATCSMLRSVRGFVGESFSRVSITSCVFAFAIGTYLVHAQTGLVAFAAVALLLSATYLVWNHKFVFAGSCFLISSLACAGLLISDVVVVSGLSPKLAHFNHWFTQLSLAGIGCVSWSVFRVWGPESWQTILRVQKTEESSWIESSLLAVLALVFSATVSLLVFEQTGFEFSREWQSFQLGDLLPAKLKSWLFSVTAVLMIATALAYYLRPSLELAIGLIVLWFTTSLAGSLYFVESRAVASAARWLLPIAGLVGAILFLCLRKIHPLIEGSRKRLSVLGPSTLSGGPTQWSINTALIVSVIITLGISTITIATVMLNGAEVLGGPIKPSLLGDLRKDVSFGSPIAILVSTFLVYAVSERRSILAAMGSSVFQYVVVLAIVLLAISPNPKLATNWFVNILQAVSLGMTGFGLVWFFNRERIVGEPIRWLPYQPKQLDVHVILNIVLISSLMVLILQRYYFNPLSSAGWIRSAGGPMGVASVVLVSILALMVWRGSLDKVVPWGFGYLGLASSAIAATLVDRHFESQPWFAFRAIAIGTVITMACQLWLCWYRDQKFWTSANSAKNSPPWFATWHTAGSMLALTLVSVLFALRGVVHDGQAFWLHWSCLACTLILVVAYSWVYRSQFSAAASVVLTGLTALSFCVNNPHQWFYDLESMTLVTVMALSSLAIAWTSFYLFSRNYLRQSISRRFHWLPNLLAMAAGIWMLLSGMIEFAASSFGWRIFEAGLFPFAIVVTAILLLVQTWNDRARWMVTSRMLWLFGLATLLASVAVNKMSISLPADMVQVKFTSWLLSLGFFSVFWGGVWLYRKSLFHVLKTVRVPRLVAADRRLESQLPVWLILMATLVLVMVWFAIFSFEKRTLRYLIAFAPVLVAAGVGCLGMTVERTWLQKMFIGLLVVGMVLVSWASLSPEQMIGIIPEVPARTLMVLAFSVFVLGALATRWARHEDSWLKSLKTMTVVLSGAAMLVLVLCTSFQWSGFDATNGSGLSQSSAVGSSMAVLSMIVGLLTIAVLPRHDPLSVSLEGRKIYVYTAQMVVVLLGIHIYLAMPWLLKLGVLKYWPYVALIISFVGVGVSSLLQKRKLEVLAEPLFNTAALIPLMVAMGFWLVRSEADAALTFLSAGLVYLAVSIMHRSLLAGVMSIVLGNIALWTFYHKISQFAFFDHPQLWLIPPALSVLVASQLLREKLTPGQLGLIRYICAFVIYLSSTGEVFIQGLGMSLWPPIVLATLSLGGMAAGIMLQVRSFLYVGSVFLLMSMVAMVSHAHRQFDHVWPWWAFGICVGAAILIGFGLLEKRRNDLSALARKLEQWDV